MSLAILPSHRSAALVLAALFTLAGCGTWMRA